MAMVQEVDADVVVDSLMKAVLTACSHLGVRFCCLSPNSIKGYSAASQPLAFLCKYPA